MTAAGGRGAGGVGRGAPGATASEAGEAILRRLRTLGARWRELDDGGAITLEFRAGGR